MSSAIAVLLVRLASWPVDRAFTNYYLKRSWREWLWIRVARRIVKPLLRLSLKVDQDAAVQQMIEEAWWGDGS